MDLVAYATNVVRSVSFHVENQLQIESMDFVDDNGSDGFSCVMNVSRGPYILNLPRMTRTASPLRLRSEALFWLRLEMHPAELHGRHLAHNTPIQFLLVA
jgi:hypothetical protein